MSVKDVLTNQVLFRWDAERAKLSVLDAERSGRVVAEVDLQTLRSMAWPDASKFLGEFITLVVPALRELYASEFRSNTEPPKTSGG